MSMEVFQVIYGSFVAKIEQLETMGINIREVFVTDMKILKIKNNFFNVKNHAIQIFSVRLQIS